MRQRITAAVALVAAIALVAVGIMMYVVESTRIDRAVHAEATRQMTEFTTMQKKGLDPNTGKPFTDVDRLLSVYLARNVPARNVVIFGFPSTGKAIFQGEVNQPLQSSPAFRGVVDDLKSGGGQRSITVRNMSYLLTVQPVIDSRHKGAFVVTQNVSASRVDLSKLMTTYALVGALAMIIIATVASTIAGRLLHPVRRLNETAQAITDSDLSRRIEVRGNDDLTELQRTFNSMLDRLESAFAEQRQMLDDVGHELRTPLTVLRGHLELLDCGDPKDVSTTRTLLLDETDRMTRLVSDLLLLAKSGHPDFVKAYEVDLEVLTNDIARKANGLGDRRWVIDHAASGSARVDGQRLTQAMLQLVDNAVRHTSPGDEIGIGSRCRADSVDLWVRDSGPGIPQADRARVFDRFERGSDHADGFGLGLSIVRAIATAHGGCVAIDPSKLGATFRLSLPLGGSS